MAGDRTIALTVSTAVFMQFLDATALITALPAMGRDLHVPVVNLNVAILAYQLSLAAFIPVGNIAADRIGARRAFAASLGLFLAGSLLCALSHTLPALVASRALQGLGGAVMMPVSRQLVIRSAAKHELVSAMNWLLIPGIVGPCSGRSSAASSSPMPIGNGSS
jgi:MFS family permease